MKKLLKTSASVLILILMGTSLLIATSCSRPMNPPPSRDVDQGIGTTGSGTTGTGTTSSGPLDSESTGSVRGSSPGSRGGEVR
jgi:hypothetical protein